MVGAQVDSCYPLVVTNSISDRLRPLHKNQIDPLLDLIESSFQCLKEDLRPFSELLSDLIYQPRLPPDKLKFEVLSKDELESMRSQEWSLKELLKPMKPSGPRTGYPTSDPSMHDDPPMQGNCAEPGNILMEMPPDVDIPRPSSVSVSMESCITMASIETPASTIDINPGNDLSDDTTKEPVAFTPSMAFPSGLGYVPMTVLIHFGRDIFQLATHNIVQDDRTDIEYVMDHIEEYQGIDRQSREPDSLPTLLFAS